MQSNPWKTAFLFFTFSFFLVGVGVGAYLLGKGALSLSKVSPSPSPTSQAESSPVTTPFLSETEMIQEAMYEFIGKGATEIEVIVDKNLGLHATGGVIDIGAEVGGAYWIAAKSGGEWVGVYAGQAHPTCEQIAPYNFPTSMVSACLDELGQVVNR